MILDAAAPSAGCCACRNVQNELHARDPAALSARRRAPPTTSIPTTCCASATSSGEGFEVAVIYHSHIDAGAYFSETDRRQALVGGEPAYPGTRLRRHLGASAAASTRSPPSAGTPTRRDFVGRWSLSRMTRVRRALCATLRRAER